MFVWVSGFTKLKLTLRYSCNIQNPSWEDLQWGACLFNSAHDRNNYSPLRVSQLGYLKLPAILKKTHFPSISYIV